MFTVLDIIGRSTDYLAGRGIESPRLSAELLIGHALGLRRMQLYLQFERLLTEAELGLIRPLIQRRGRHEPVQYIVGETEFCGLRLRVDPRVLIPRPETEQLVEQILGFLPAPPARILDLGTGSGAIALALAQAYPDAAITATDISPAALALAETNAAANGLAGRVRFLASDWFAAVPPEAWSLIVSNPPYLSCSETARSPREVHEHEPTQALLAGDDGLADLAAIIAGARNFLEVGGVLALETGSAQHVRLVPRLQVAGFGEIQSRQDFAARERFLLARR